MLLGVAAPVGPWYLVSRNQLTNCDALTAAIKCRQALGEITMGSVVSAHSLSRTSTASGRNDTSMQWMTSQWVDLCHPLAFPAQSGSDCFLMVT